MMNRKMKQLALAVGVALGGISLLPSAQAVSVSADNLGQALIFPYYTVRAGWNTLLGVTNTSDRVIAVKVRFREALNSRDVFDFNIILSPYDLWTGYMADSSGGPVLFAADGSCTIGRIPATGQPFTTTAFTGSAADGGPTTVDRLREGYVEMIMMGAAPAKPGTLASGAIHVDGVVPTAGCNELNKAFTTPSRLAEVQGAFNEIIPSPLKGTYSLVNQAPGNGFNAVGLPTALNNFRTAPWVTLQAPPGPSVLFKDSGYEPTLAAANTQGVYYNRADDKLVPGPVPGPATSGADAVSFALWTKNILNEWTRRDNPADGWTTLTDWVITFPTKQFYVDTKNAGSNVHSGRYPDRVGGLPQPAPFLFSEAFDGKSCDPVDIQVYDREEQLAPISAFSPWVTPQLCYEANVLSFNIGAENALLDSPYKSVIDYPDDFLYGWTNVTFTRNPLPGIGFAITSRDSATSLLSEAAAYDHSYIRP